MSNIRPAEHKDIQHLKKLIDENISEDYFSENYIENILNSDNNYIYVCVDEENIPVAMIYCVVTSLEDAMKIGYIPIDTLALKGFDKNSRTCLYKTTCTSKEYRDTGILHSFMKKIDSITDKLDFERSIVLSLIYANGVIPTDHVLSETGFIKTQRIIKPWNGIKSHCNYCGKDYCTCDGMLYIKERLNEKQN